MYINRDTIRNIRQRALRFICKLIPALTGIALMLAIILCPFVATTDIGSGYEQLRPSFLAKDINIDGVHYDNYFLEKPIVHAHGEYYIPATEQMLGALGIRFRKITNEPREFDYGDALNTPFWKTAKTFLEKSYTECADPDDIIEFKISEGTPFEQGNTLVTNLRSYVEIETGPSTMIAKVVDFGGMDLRNGWERLWAQYRERRAEAKGQTVQSEIPVLISDNGEDLFYDCDNLMYFSTEFLEKLGIDCWYDEITGLYMSSREGVSADSLYDEELAKRIDVLSEHIVTVSKTADKKTAVKYEYIFRHEANVSGVDELVIMGVAQTESRYHENSIGTGSVGMMQTLVKYAVNYGYDRQMLLTAHYSIELGTKYLMDRLHMFGDEELMLVAYNRGSASVRAGRKTSTYSRKVLQIKEGLLAKLEN